MKFLRLASGLALAVTMSTTAAEAVTLSQAAQPAERPPASYGADVYVDSRGCAYVRATIGSVVNWVPRLSPDRKTVVCGLTPTAQVAGLASARPPAPPTPPAPVAVAAPALTSAPAEAAPVRPVAAAAPASNEVTRTMAITCPANGATARVRLGGDTVSITCSPSQTTAKSYIVRHANGDRTRLIAKPPVDTVPAAPAVAANGRRLAYGDVSANGRVRIGGVQPGGATNGLGNGYRFGNGFAVTTYPGAMDPVPSAGAFGQARTANPNAPGPVPGTGAAGTGFANGYNLAPVPNAGRAVIPEGYRPAWQDGRLNPMRGPRSLQGDMQMAQVMTIDEVPMRTVNLVPAQGLVYQPDQPREGLYLSTKSPSQVPATVARTASAPVTPASAAAPAKRYVQVGQFNVAANAKNAAAKLQSLGLPGRVANTRSGKTVVIAGPYDSVSALNAALSAARRGFPDAFLRN